MQPSSLICDQRIASKKFDQAILYLLVCVAVVRWHLSLELDCIITINITKGIDLCLIGAFLPCMYMVFGHPTLTHVQIWLSHTPHPLHIHSPFPFSVVAFRPMRKHGGMDDAKLAFDK